MSEHAGLRGQTWFAALTGRREADLIHDPGEPKSVLVINTDVTDKRKIEAQFLRAQRMESIGSLASGIAHDLNNVLAPILMAAALKGSK